MDNNRAWFLDGSEEDREEFFEPPPAKSEPDRTLPLRRRTASPDPVVANLQPEPAPTIPIRPEQIEGAAEPMVRVCPPPDVGSLFSPANPVESPTPAPTLAGVLLLTRSPQPVRRGQVFSLKAVRTVIGSGRKSGCVIDDAGVADCHAVVTYELREGVNGFYLYPVPPHATSVNRMPVEAAWKLETGDRIEMGGSAMVFFAAPLEEFRP